MTKIINYVLIIILGLLIGYLIIQPKLNNKNLQDSYDSIVYIESYDDETIKSGSGFVYKSTDNKNYIITSYHVVDNGFDIYIYNTNKDREKAILVNYDESADIAILSVDDSLNLEKINIGNSDNVEIGDDIYVMGTPLNIDYISTLSKGIVSFVNRKITINTPNAKNTYDAIQLDARIDKGNSGGPVLNNKGKIIGMVFVKEENVEGIGFALPINYIMDIVTKIEGKKGI